MISIFKMMWGGWRGTQTAEIRNNQMGFFSFYVCHLHMTKAKQGYIFFVFIYYKFACLHATIPSHLFLTHECHP